MLSIRRRVAQLGALGLLGLALACQAPAPAPTTGGGGASQPSANPIKIGALFSTTGTLAPFGQDALPGAQIFVEEINARGGINGRPLELVSVDDESKPEQTVTAAKR